MTTIFFASLFVTFKTYIFSRNMSRRARVIKGVLVRWKVSKSILILIKNYISVVTDKSNKYNMQHTLRT